MCQLELGGMAGWMALLLTLGLAAADLPSLLLKQAADSLLAAPFGSSEPQYHGPARVEVPSPEDLLVSRLQGELAVRVDDNWLSINDPQRWAIMQTKDPAKQILKSFEQIKTSAEQLEQAVDVDSLEQALNRLELEGEERDQWVPYWERVRRQVGKMAQFYNYFRGYIEKGDTIASDTLLDFATSMKLADLVTMLDTFHSTVTPRDSSGLQLFPALHSLLEVSPPHLLLTWCSWPGRDPVHYVLIGYSFNLIMMIMLMKLHSDNTKFP